MWSSPKFAYRRTGTGSVDMIDQLAARYVQVSSRSMEQNGKKKDSHRGLARAGLPVAAAVSSFSSDGVGSQLLLTVRYPAVWTLKIRRHGTLYYVQCRRILLLLVANKTTRQVRLKYETKVGNQSC